MQLYPLDNPLNANGVPLYVIPTCLRAGNIVVNNDEEGYDFLNDLCRAIDASKMPISEQYGATARQLLDFAQPSIARGAVHQCAMGDVEILFVPTTLDGRPWYYFQWDKFVKPDPRPKRTAAQEAELQQGIRAANDQRKRNKDAIQAEADLWTMYRSHPSAFILDAPNLYWLEQLASSRGRYALVLWLQKHTMADYNAMLAKVHMATQSITALKALLKANGQPTSGKKPDLVRRAQSLPTNVQRAYLEAKP